MKRLIYLDFAAATPIDDRVMLVMEPYFKTDFYNPSANYLEAKRVANKLSEARATVASIQGA